MKHRSKIDKKSSKRLFSKTADLMHRKNLPKKIMRGGIRL